MKNYYQILALCLAIFSLSSCSQTQEVTQNSEHEYRYKKVYVGNKIIYRDAEESTTTLDLNNPSLVAIAEDQEVITPLETYTDNALPEASLTADKEVKPSFSFAYYADALSKRKLLQKNSDNLESEEDYTQDSGGVMGLLGFIFSLLGLLLLFVVPLVGLLFLIAGLILSIIGTDGTNRGLAIAGVIIASVGLLLFLILIIAAVAFIASYGV